MVRKSNRELKFNRINSKGTSLSKYQILSATWTAYEYTLSSNELNPIFEYVDKFYVSILNDQFEVEGYNHIDVNETGRLNFYQIMYGFSKLLSNRFPYLFTKSSKKEGVESSGFNLVNCCLGNRNNNIAELPKILNETFDDDKQINDFLVNIIHCTDNVYKLLKPYLEFKLNRRDSIEIYHSEFQICSMIANYFNNRYVTYSFDDKGNIIGRNIKTKETNKNFKDFKKQFKNNAFKKYLKDIIEDNWKGSGDSNMDRIALDKNYYSGDIDVNTMENALDYWFNQVNTNRQEYKKVQVPKAPEKLLLSIIYGHLFIAIDQNDENIYDIEHLAPKGKLKILLGQFNNGNDDKKLPISSFGNLCLLAEGINRKKRDKTLYEDNIYLNKIKNKHISLDEIETKFTFTTKEDLDWINKDYHSYNDLKYDYTFFINNRFKKQKKLILQNLFPDEDLTYISNESVTYITTGYVNQHITNTSLTKPFFIIHDKNSGFSYYDILNQLKGWQKDIFLIINDFDEDTFTLKDLYAYKDELQALHPNNTTIDAKIRATLQQLRDMEIIEFVSKGVYKRLWKA